MFRKFLEVWRYFFHDEGDLKFALEKLYCDLIAWGLRPDLRDEVYLEQIISRNVLVKKMLSRNPSLKSYAESILAKCYVFAAEKLVRGRVIERSMLRDDFPETLDGVLKLPTQYMRDYCKSLSDNTGEEK